MNTTFIPQTKSNSNLDFERQETNRKPRISMIDALRGFAVMAIVLLHNIEHFNFYHFPDKTGQAEWLTWMDSKVWETMFLLFGGKTYSIFAVLFGFTFYLMNHKQQSQEKDFGPRYLWRLLLLFFFACVNAMFFAGEVLLLYSICGIVLFIGRNWKENTVLIASVCLLAQPMEWYHFIMQSLTENYTMPAKISSSMWQGVMDYIKAGNIWETYSQNLTKGQLWSLLWAVENGRFTQTCGLFLLGFWLGKKQVFTQFEANKKFWIKSLFIAFIISVPLYFSNNFLNEHPVANIKNSVGVITDMWWKLSCTLVWISLFAILYASPFFQKITKPLVPYGKMSLTNYITQSMIGGYLYYMYGLGWAAKYGVTYSLIIGIVFFLVQLGFCHLWLSRFKKGPLEWLWHKGTWARLR
ncbi:DUF418 domain-containing protein [Aureibacter tunicatorum]|uniref:DUF418 domain-containing protein n=1 Tax=Aureibacter tunicatorum TaxID=866807 RepID=A0AAE3XRH0_9BACT|nr:DUF418 domain-containing protein [Aureibacter tunicatorum]MDR6240674.1 uncharacterized protein [Aureibacter tunicatorum]BDD06993.1 membrane protein [Aureibacter tunicatorum]